MFATATISSWPLAGKVVSSGAASYPAVSSAHARAARAGVSAGDSGNQHRSAR
jgi:hypothetical protein